ncbi:MAG: ParA family protein [Micrococcales bacterium]
MSKTDSKDTRFPVPAPLKQHGPARIIAMCNQKGGVGKTTSTINLGAALAEYGRKVLLVDFDPQGALSAGLGINAYTNEPTILDLLLTKNFQTKDVVRPTSVENLDVLPANIDLAAAELALVTEMNREHILKRVLRQVADDYDVILIDCQPSLGLLTINALTAAHGVIIPLAPEFFALRAIALLEQIMGKVRDSENNPSLKLDAILVTMYDSRTNHGREVLERVREGFPEVTLRAMIPKTIKFSESVVHLKPITQSASDSAAAEAYRAVARELVQRGCTP